MKRDKFVDIIKAIGIISIVIGHSVWSISKFDLKIGPFVYMYHLMIFIFVSGYLFPIQKTNDKEEMYKYIGKHIYNMLILCFIYNFIFVVIHNYLIKINIIDSSFYNKREIILNCLNGITFRFSEKLLGAFWFLPMMLIAEILFVISINIINRFNKNKYMYILFPLVFAILGTILCYKNINLNYKMQISILAVPFMYIGVLMKKYWNKVEKYIFLYGWIISLFILVCIIRMKIGNIELYMNEIINPFAFYPVSMIEIYFCLSLAKMFNKIKIVRDIIAYIGKNSFHIMALHLLSIKIVDIIYSKIHNINDIKIISKFPRSYSNDLWVIYTIIGICLPIFLAVLIEKIKKKGIDKENERYTINKHNNTSLQCRKIYTKMLK